jgi:hypothetical protein
VVGDCQMKISTTNGSKRGGNSQQKFRSKAVTFGQNPEVEIYLKEDIRPHWLLMSKHFCVMSLQPSSPSELFKALSEWGYQPQHPLIVKFPIINDQQIARRASRLYNEWYRHSNPALAVKIYRPGVPKPSWAVVEPNAQEWNTQLTDKQLAARLLGFYQGTRRILWSNLLRDGFPHSVLRPSIHAVRPDSPESLVFCSQLSALDEKTLVTAWCSEIDTYPCLLSMMLGLYLLERPRFEMAYKDYTLKGQVLPNPFLSSLGELLRLIAQELRVSEPDLAAESRPGLPGHPSRGRFSLKIWLEQMQWLEKSCDDPAAVSQLWRSMVAYLELGQVQPVQPVMIPPRKQVSYPCSAVLMASPSSNEVDTFRKTGLNHHSNSAFKPWQTYLEQQPLRQKTVSRMFPW